MSKNGQKMLAVVLVMAIVCALCTWFFIYQHDKNLYGMTAVVTHISEATDTVTIQDFNGNLWQFKGVEDWEVGDVASCIMDSKGTTLIKDDEIVKVKYSGYFQGWSSLTPQVGSVG